MRCLSAMAPLQIHALLSPSRRSSVSLGLSRAWQPCSQGRPGHEAGRTQPGGTEHGHQQIAPLIRDPEHPQ